MFALLLVGLNLPLLTGRWASEGTFLPVAVAQGEWWRILTHPFVHVSAYHLLLDAAAFFLLYTGLTDFSRFQRLGCVGATALGSLGISLWAAPQISQAGLCGLSGVAHGLMAVTAVEMMRRQNDRLIFRAGLLTLLVVVLKSGLEAATGQVLFASWHFGRLGTPIAVCHAGGALGGLLWWCVSRRRLISQSGRGASWSSE